MQIVIDIPDRVYKIVQSKRLNLIDIDVLEQAVLNGKPLPKGHGRLIDADEYKEHLYACETNGRPLHIMELDERLATIDNAPTIIEADTESEVQE